MIDTPQITSAEASGLTALYFNTSLKPDPSASHTQKLIYSSSRIMEQAGAQVEHIHMASHQIAHGIYPDMTEHGAKQDDWPRIWEKVNAADIVVIGTPLWLGEESSYCRILIERLYAMSAELNDKNQSIFYGKTGGSMITGNEDGIKHTSMSILYALQHVGFTVPPQADCGWIGEAGPGPSYGDGQDDADPVGFDNDFTRRNTIIMTWNLIHMANLLKKSGGLPRTGNDRKALGDGDKFGFEYPAEPIQAEED